LSMEASAAEPAALAAAEPAALQVTQQTDNALSYSQAQTTRHGNLRCTANFLSAERRTATD
jgi:hypothetical protein